MSQIWSSVTIYNVSSHRSIYGAKYMTKQHFITDFILWRFSNDLWRIIGIMDWSISCSASVGKERVDATSAHLLVPSIPLFTSPTVLQLCFPLRIRSDKIIRVPLSLPPVRVGIIIGCKQAECWDGGGKRERGEEKEEKQAVTLQPTLTPELRDFVRETSWP